MKFDRTARKKRAREADFALPHDLVAHPRARQMARASPRSVPDMRVHEIRARVWQMRASTIVPGTAILASGDGPWGPAFSRHVYADLLKPCADCGRDFLFYANEQRFWYETLRLPPDVDCTRCVPCRKLARRLKACLRRYADALQAPRLDAKDMKTFVDDALFLLEQGAVRNLARLGAIKNRAQRELPDYPGTRLLAGALAAAHEAAQMRPGAWRDRRW